MSEFEGLKPYTQAELDQHAIWADEFDQWWENEGQYQRAGGGQYERSFAWWAWLNREQKQQAIIDNLKAQLNNMEACYIEKKRQVEELQKTNISLEAGLRKNSKNKQKLLGKNIALQKRIDEALQEVKGLERFTGEDCIADFDVLQGAVSHACKRLEKTLRGAND
ncbi:MULTISPECIES: hypothetical protein [unclassified Acinetobacter]|uniref:hypothetical protein n=1 Tax=unclassified Acinetobacter TaxID=196816 RepID=UPI0015D29215|nr:MULTISPECIES: hypothetical protein [unclassified Acinetobacter]